MPDAPLTFLVSDIEGSTRLWERFPDAMRDVLAHHDGILRACIEDRGGTVFKTVGDGFYTAFTGTADALDAALAVQQTLQAEEWGEIGSLRVRMALHVGTAQKRDNDFFGQTLNRISRLLAIGHGGQILLSEAARQEAGSFLPPDASLRDMGKHRLKDLQQPEWVFQLLHPALPADFPELRSLSRLSNNLPPQLSSFVGREQELAKVKSLLTSTRLLTLLGAGGSGKTRLSQQAAADLIDDYPQGVWLVELAALTDGSLIPQAVASALSVREEGGRPLLETLGDALQDRTLLLLLDNCEHLIEAAAQLAEGLLRRCPNLRILATSREALNISGETTWQVPSLSLPSADDAPSFARLMQSEAVRLFAERAVSSKPDFAVTTENAGAVLQICRRLDGIPLAIELAAARVRVLSPEQIATKLDDCFRILTGGSRTALPRQQTLRAAIDWSYTLLSEPESLLLRRLSIFAGGWTLEAAETVCADDDIEAWEVLDLLSRLLDKSLVVREESEGETRYRLLETIRQYGRDLLHSENETPRLRAGHLQWFVALSEHAAPELQTGQQQQWLTRLEAEHDNLRTALEWASEHDVQAGLRIGGAIWRFWATRGYFHEGRHWLETLLSASLQDGLVSAQQTVRARAMNGLGALAHRQSDYTLARSIYEELLSLRRDLDDKQGIAGALNNLGFVVREQGDYTLARQLHEESLALKREIGDAYGVAGSLNNLGLLDCDEGDYLMAQSRFEECVSLKRGLDDPENLASSLDNLGYVRYRQKQYDKAQELYRESLRLRQTLADKRGVADNLEGLAKLAQAQAQWERAALLFGAGAKLRDTLGVPILFERREDHEQQVAATRAHLGVIRFEEFWEEGYAMERQQAVAFALEEAGSEPSRFFSLAGMPQPNVCGDALASSLLPSIH